ncbi:HTH domain-containing protein [Clostridium tyrobutyricum]|uniref:HTH domain-containing protein n=1 Tax=Clostridium tyrobutyricum TaxID=1519 RepID=UPI0030D42BDC
MGKNFKELVDMETGEITVVESTYSPQTHEIRNIRQADYQKKWREQGANQFTWAFQRDIRTLLSENKINLTSLGAVLVLLPYLDNDGYLKRRTVEGKPMLTRKDIKEILKVSEVTLKRTLKALKDTGIIAVEGSRRNQIFKLNTDLHLRGQLPDGVIEAVRIQNKGIKALHEETNIKLDTLGFLYLLIPYISYKSCMLVKNVNKPEELINSLSMEELCEELKMADRTVNKYLKLKFKYSFKDGYYEVPAFVFVTNPSYPKKKATLINPMLVRRNMEITGEIRFSELDCVFKSMSKKL